MWKRSKTSGPWQNKAGGNPAVRSIADVEKIHVADVMTAASFLVGERMGLQAGRVSVGDAGALAFEADPDGPHRLATQRLEGTDYRAEIVRRILAVG